MAFPARYPGRCACGQSFNAGDMIGKDADGSYRHAACVGGTIHIAPARKPRRHASNAIELWAAQGIVYLAGMDADRATALNGVGFNKIDGDAGHDFADRLSRNEDLTDGQWAYVVKMATRYQRQIGPKPSPNAMMDSVVSLSQNRCGCGGHYEFIPECGAHVCLSCGNHKGLCRCYCGWAASGGDGCAELIEMGETIDPD